MAYFTGLAFPFGKSSTEFPARATDEDLIKQSLIQIISTFLGERVMRPTFGSNAYDFIFENDSIAFKEFVKASVRKSITTNESRVTIVGIFVDRDDTDETQMTIKLEYVVNSTQNRDNVTVAFGSSATSSLGA